MNRPLTLALCAFVLAPALALGERPAQAPAPPAFDVVETTITQVHAAMKAGRLTCHALVDSYLKRIAAFDKTGPALNAIVITNPDALKQADDLDRRFARGGFVGPLHCVPTIVKDNFETIGLQSADGSAWPPTEFR